MNQGLDGRNLGNLRKDLTPLIGVEVRGLTYKNGISAMSGFGECKKGKDHLGKVRLVIKGALLFSILEHESIIPSTIPFIYFK